MMKYFRQQRAISPLQGSLCSNSPSKRALVAAQRKQRWLPHLCWHSSISLLLLNISRSSSPFWPQTWAPNRSFHRHRRLWRLVMPLGALEQVWEASWFMTVPRELLQAIKKPSTMERLSSVGIRSRSWLSSSARCSRRLVGSTRISSRSRWQTQWSRSLSSNP